MLNQLNAVVMKKVLIITWTVIMLVIILFFIKHLHEKNITSTMDLSQYIDKSTDVFSKHTLDSLILTNEYILLTIGYGDCSLCDILRLDNTPDKFPVGRYYIDATYDNNNMLVMQSLYFSGFPVSYVINQDYNIIGAMTGLVDLEERLDSIINGQHRLLPKIIHDIPKAKTHSLLSNSFKGLLAYLENDRENMRKYAKASLNEGSFFFNNYLIYEYFKELHCIDSTNYYKEQMLNDISGRDAYFYETLLIEIDPSNDALLWLHHHEH